MITDEKIQFFVKIKRHEVIFCEIDFDPENFRMLK